MSQLRKFTHQTLTAKGFYSSGVLFRLRPEKSRDEVELKLISNYLATVRDFASSTFLFVGAGYGRLIEELAVTHTPKRVIAVEIVDYYADEITKNVPSREDVEIVIEDYFEFPYETVGEDRAVILLNWSIIADFGSIEAIQYMFERFKDTAKEVLVIGDMPHQATYKPQIDSYFAQHPEETYGTFVMRHINNEGDFKSFLPTSAFLIDAVQKLGYSLELFEEYQDETGNGRYMVGFRST